MVNEELYLIELATVFIPETSEEDWDDVLGLSLIRILKQEYQFRIRICSVVPVLGEGNIIRDFAVESNFGYSNHFDLPQVEVDQQSSDFLKIKELLAKLFVGEKLSAFYKLESLSVPMSRIDELESILQTRLDLKI
jgi:hypothetical protein